MVKRTILKVEITFKYKKNLIKLSAISIAIRSNKSYTINSINTKGQFDIKSLFQKSKVIEIGD